MGIVHTEKGRCKGCYACVRNCPCKAIKVENGLAEVIEERCIACGTCLPVCPTGAKVVESDIGVVTGLLKNYPDVIAIPSSSFPAAFPGSRPGQLVAALKRLGFSAVMEDSFGAELVCREYSRIIQERKGKLTLSSTCPAIILYIEKYYPQLIENLAPIVSPMTAMGLMIKQKINPEARVVFIGPCLAKKAESRDKNIAGAIDAVLTFAEVKQMFAKSGIMLESQPDDEFSGPQPNLGRLFAISGGLLKATGLSDDILQNEVISAHGVDYVIKILREIAAGEINAKFINIYFCHGCIDGPAIDNDLSTFRRKELVSQYTRERMDTAQTALDIEEHIDVDLRRSFTPQSAGLPVPSKEQIRDVLIRMNKANPENQFNCGSCGYRSCRDLAVAVCQGLAEVNMCWPYVLEQLRDTQAELIQAEKLTSLGQLAASIAHEVNNPLAGILVYTQLLAKKMSNDKLTRDVGLTYLNKMETELKRSTKMIRNLLDFARQSPPDLREVDINEVLVRAFDLVSHSAQIQNIEVLKEFAPSLPRLLADYDQLQQVFVNLILNAIQAMPDEGTLNLQTSVSRNHLKIVFQDTGCGISTENMRKLFTPFFTTKKEVKGVGLGLAVSYGIVQRHRGRIEVQSKEGEGTTFTVFLPVNYEGES